MQGGGVGLGGPAPAVQGALDGRDLVRVQSTHLLADVLHLAAPAFVILDLLAFEDGFAHIFGHGDAFDAVARLGDELFAELLQGRRFAFQLRFGRAFVFLFELAGLEAAGAAVGIWHDGDSNES